MIIKNLSKYSFLLVLIAATSYPQDHSSSSEHDSAYFVSLNYGIQMSGIKDEDFISSNYSPLFNFIAGKWVSPYLALQIGYKGFYFNAIADDFKHHYNYFYAEAVLNANNLLDPKRISKFWRILLHAGPGYFYNHLYGSANIHINLGIQNTFQLSDNFHASLDATSIVGWDIYQGNEDILPGLTIGLIYLFDIK